MTSLRAATLALAGMLAGCTLVGAIAGGTLASERDRKEHLHRTSSAASESTVMPATLGGAAIGMILDAVAIAFLIDQGRD